MIKFSSEQPKVVVVGSSSVDLVIRTPRTPKSGETVMATHTETFFGGKGANEAMACARLGAQVHFIGAVGMEPTGQQILRNLVEAGIHVGFVYETPESESGQAFVIASDNHNTILVEPAANFDLQPKHIAAAERYFQSADLVLVQLEIPQPAVLYTARMAKKYGVKLGLYAAPAQALTVELIAAADFIVAKKEEVDILFGESEADELCRRYPNKLFLRTEENCTQFYDGTEMKSHRNLSQPVLHKMGMGDAFTAGFGMALCHGNELKKCVDFGNLMALMVAQERGSQRGLPTFKSLSQKKMI